MTAILISQVGSNFGYMWGAVIHDENQSIVSALVYLLLSAIGAGKFSNLQTLSPAVKLISDLSPVRYSVERIFRRITS